MLPDSLPHGTVIAGRYAVEGKLGEGGMGAVYRVRHVHTDEYFALKVLHRAASRDPVAIARFRREARAPARIDSDHVVRVTDADVAPELDGVPFLVMELLRGKDLEEVLQRNGGTLPPALVVDYLGQAARALDKAHAIGVVHRDLKPENLFLADREDGTTLVKLLDFGLARFATSIGTDMSTIEQTKTGQVFGTPVFMAPEQALGEVSSIGPRTDVWALGLIAFRLLTGHDYWTAATITHLIGQIAYEPLVRASVRGARMGEAFDAWFARCCARAIDDRFPTAGEAIAELASALGVAEERRDAPPPEEATAVYPLVRSATSATSGKSTSTNPKSRARRGLRWFVVALCAMAAGGVAAVVLFSRGAVLRRVAAHSEPPQASSAPASVGSREETTAAPATSSDTATLSPAPAPSAQAPTPAGDVDGGVPRVVNGAGERAPLPTPSVSSRARSSPPVASQNPRPSDDSLLDNRH